MRAWQYSFVCVYDCKILEILDRWYEDGIEPGKPAADYFKVNAEGGIYILPYTAETDTWFVLS